MLTSKNLPGEFLISEGNGQISRERLLVAATAIELIAGTLLALPEGEDEYVPYAPGVDAPEASAILYAGLPVSAEAQRAVGIVRLAEVAEDLLIGLTPEALISLEALNIIVRQ